MLIHEAVNRPTLVDKTKGPYYLGINLARSKIRIRAFMSKRRD